MRNISVQNHAIYSNEKICNSYLNVHELFESEKAVLKYLRDYIKEGDKILDIGVGTGRTTQFLRQLSKNYAGIDYSEKMIEIARKALPGIDFFVGDVRDLSPFGTNEYDLVFFSFNGLDYIPHDDRIVALKGILRALKKNGIFAFSTHNSNYVNFDRLIMKYSGGSIIRFGWTVLSGFFSRFKNLRSHVYADNYSIITDPGHNYRLLTYYIAPENQVKQLKDCGFSDQVLIFDNKGNNVSNSADSSWLYYLTRKP